MPTIAAAGKLGSSVKLGEGKWVMAFINTEMGFHLHQQQFKEGEQEDPRIPGI